MTAGAEHLVEMLRAAGEPTRLRVLALLAREELAVMELAQILGHSQPRVSRHLKLLAQAGLVERFPDGAWVFYRLCGGEPQRGFLQGLLEMIAPDDPAHRQDLEKLDAVRRTRHAEAQDYFARNAARWDEIRSLYVAEDAVEAAILQAAGPGPYRRLIDLGTGSGRMLTLLAPQAAQAIGLDLSQQMLNLARAQTAQAGLARVELRHGDIHATGLPGASADRVVIHRVLHYLGDPAGAVTEAARLLTRGRAAADRGLRPPQPGVPARGASAPPPGLLGRGDRALDRPGRAPGPERRGAAAGGRRRPDRKGLERRPRRSGRD